MFIATKSDSKYAFESRVSQEVKKKKQPAPLEQSDFLILIWQIMVLLGIVYYRLKWCSTIGYGVNVISNKIKIFPGLDLDELKKKAKSVQLSRSLDWAWQQNILSIFLFSYRPLFLPAWGLNFL